MEEGKKRKENEKGDEGEKDGEKDDEDASQLVSRKNVSRSKCYQVKK